MRRIGDFLHRPRPIGLLLAGSLACAMVYVPAIFGFDFVIGTSDFWQDPRGILRNSFADMPQSLSGYNYFVRGAWGVPLFLAPRLGVPDGTNIIFTDSIPIVAMLGRLVYRASGQVVNLYGGWIALCFVGAATSMTGLVAALGQRGIAAALMATTAGLCMPALLARWGHMSLMAQWEIPLAWTLYFASRAGHRGGRVIAPSLLLCALALWTNAYMFVMVAGIAAATFAQAVFDRRLDRARATLIGVGGAAALAGLLLLSGYVSSWGSLTADGFGAYSMNLLSPIVPQWSELVPILPETIVDATGGQYEGFCYLGAGLLVLTALALPWLGRALASRWRAHVCILALLAGFTLFAISNEVFIGLWHAASIPLPARVLAMASVFRSSGRFIWPGLYLLAAATIVAAASQPARQGSLVLVVAAALQFADTVPLRSALAASSDHPASPPLPQAPWMAAIRQHELVRVVPSYLCIADPRGLAAAIAVEMQLLASRENVATNTVYATRHRYDCAEPDAALAPKELRVYLLAAKPAHVPDAGGHCAASPAIAVCSEQLGGAGAAALIAAPP